MSDPKSSSEVTDSDTLPSSQEFVDLPSGEALTPDQAGDVARDAPTNLIIVAGPYDSGKTTILTALFEAFLEAPFANFLFRGSKTLMGFERRCHLGREESGQLTPQTSHTSIREGVVFLHLDLSVNDEGAPEHKHLLISDISGEIFRQLRDSSEAVMSMHVLRRANCLCLILDGRKIISKEQRHLARNDSRLILRSIVEQQMLASDAVIDVAFTKWDLVVEALADEAAAADLEQYIADTKNALIATAPDHQMRFHEVAARPTSSKVPFAHGLPTLTRSWFGADRFVGRKPHTEKLQTSMREFNRFTEGVLASVRKEGGINVRPS